MRKNLLNNQFNLNANNLQNQKPYFNNNINIQTQEQNADRIKDCIKEFSCKACEITNKYSDYYLNN